MYLTLWPLFSGQYTEKVAGICIHVYGLPVNLIFETYENYTSSGTHIYIKIIVSALHCN